MSSYIFFLSFFIGAPQLADYFKYTHPTCNNKGTITNVEGDIEYIMLALTFSLLHNCSLISEGFLTELITNLTEPHLAGAT